MIHLTMAEAVVYGIGGLVALWVLRKLVPIVWGVAKLLPRIAFRLGIVALAGAELWLLLTHPPVFAAEFAVVALAGFGWRRYEHQNGHSPLIAVKRLVLRKHEPTPLEELVEDVVVLKPEDSVLPAQVVADKVGPARRRARVRRAAPIDWDSQLATYEELWAPGEWEDIARKVFGQDPNGGDSK